MTDFHFNATGTYRERRHDVGDHAMAQKASAARLTTQTKIHPTDSLSIAPSRGASAALELAKAVRAVPPASFNDLPAELVESVLRTCDDVGAKQLPFVNASTLAIARNMPELRWKQRVLDNAVVGLTEDRLLAALERHQRLLRCRREPLLLPQSTSMPCLQAIAKLVVGSRQRPMLVLSFESPRARENFPSGLTVRMLTFCENMDENIRRRYRAELQFTPTIQDFYIFERMKADGLAITDPKDDAGS